MKICLCLDCAPAKHSTIDHGGYGRGECLVDGCLCQKMNPGEEAPAKAKPMSVELKRSLDPQP